MHIPEEDGRRTFAGLTADRPAASSSAPLTRLCTICGTPAPPTAKFCSECGDHLAPDASSAQRRRFGSPKSYTPKHLASKILTARTAIEGERKQISVLFADIKGSMELVANRDPEDAQRLMDPVIEHMMEAVHYYEGIVNRVMGDGIMALFGAPIAHEDHAVRACYAALRMQAVVAQYASELQRGLGFEVAIRVGISSGEIVIAAIGSDLYMEYTIVGQTAHLASRMKQMARPGAVLATIDTFRLVEGYVEVKPLGALAVKGLTNPVEVYEIAGRAPERTRLQAALGRGLTRFVGRENELAELRSAAERASKGNGQVVAIVGEPGVGKSRLVYEFVRAMDTSGFVVLETNSAPYGHSTAYLPVIELLRRSYFNINIRDSTKSIREKVASRVVALDSTLHDAIAPLLDLLDALEPGDPFQSLDPVQHRQFTYQAISRLLLTESRKQPLVVVFEDLHWNDSLTLGLLNDVVVSAQKAPLLLLVSYRPEYRDDWRSRPNYRQLRLDPLGSESFVDFVGALVGSHSTLSGLKSFLLDRAGGNPFFVEEIVRSLADTGVLAGQRGSYRLAQPFSSSDVPPTVQAVLAARIDALPSIEKHVLQEAAVIGRDFPFALLQEIGTWDENELRALLSDLQDAEFLYATQLIPDLQYTFKHALTHDVAYSGLLQDRRRDIHARVVGAMEKLYADRLGEQVERLAEHALRGQLREQAIAYLRQAGVKAADREAYREALALFEQALGALTQLEQTHDRVALGIDLRFDIRNVLQPLGDRARIAEYLHEAEQLADRLDDTHRLGWVQSYLTDQFWMLGRYRESILAGERALTIAAQFSDLPLSVVTNLPLGLAHHTRGDYRRALRSFGWNAAHLNKALARERFGMFVVPAAFARSFMAWALADIGDFGEASSIGADALAIAEEAKHPFSCGYAHLGLGVVALRRGQLGNALRSFERSLAEGAFADSPVGFAFVALHLGYTLSLLGRAEEGIPILQESVRIAEAKGFVARHALRLAYMGEACLQADRFDEAVVAGSRALELSQRHDERANEAYALRVLGEIDARRGSNTDAEARFRAALQLAIDLEMRPLEAHCNRSLSKLLEARKCAAEADVHRKYAAQMAEDMQLAFWDDQARNANTAAR